MADPDRAARPASNSLDRKIGLVAWSLGSILPEPIEAVGAELGISRTVCMMLGWPHEVLQRSGVDAVVGELEAAGMAQHVQMNREGKLGQFPSPADHFEEPGPRHRTCAYRKRRPF